MINRDLVAVLGLVAAVAIMGGALTNTVNQFSFFSEENENLKQQNQIIESQNKQLGSKISKLQSELDILKSDMSMSAAAKPDRSMLDVKPASATLAQGLVSEIKEEKNIVIKTQEQLSEIWNEMKIDEPVPTVDFTQNTVLAAFYGQKSNTCHTINIDRVERFDMAEDVIYAIVELSKTIPTEDSECRDGLVQPYHIVQVPIKPTEVIFKE